MTEAVMRSSDPNAAQRGAADPSASVWVAASAGTGKTKVLTDRVLSLMLTGTRPQRILCLTFTKAATAEMKSRIAERLGIWAAANEADLNNDLFQLLGRKVDDGERILARQLFARVLDTPGGMNIQTIHAFCQSLLGRFPLEAGIAPHFSVMDENDAGELLAAARESVLIAAEQEQGALAEALSEVTRHLHETGFAELMASLASSRSRLRRILDRHGSTEAAVAAIQKLLGIESGETPETVIADACADKVCDVSGLRRAVSALDRGSDKNRERAAVVANWLEATPVNRLATFERYLTAFLTSGTPPSVLKNLIVMKAAATDPGTEEILRKEGERLLQTIMKRRSAATGQATAALLTLGDALLKAYQRLKDARSLLDYDDLIARVVRLLETQGAASWVLYKLDGGIDHVLIDEAQDTSPEQWAIVRLLTGEFFAGSGSRQDLRTVFAVGDVKQSIFSFQGAAPEEFVTNRDLFDKQVTGAGEIWRPIDMTVSFRSTRAVLAAVDAVFAADGVSDGVALDGQPIQHQAWRKEQGGAVEIWPPLEPRETDEPAPWKPPVEQVPGDSPPGRLARLIARRIQKMIDGSEMLESEARPISARDIMVLVRRRTAFVEELVRELKLQNVPVTGVDRMVLTSQISVMDLVALGRFALLPTDDLTLATVLRGPLIGLDEDQLFQLAYARNGALWDALRVKASADKDIAKAHRVLSDILAISDTMPPFEFYARVLGPGNGRRKLLARLGREAEDPIAEFLDMAQTFERTHAASLEGFLHWLEAGSVQIKRDLEQEEHNAVRVMTVHGAKGLQAPIVFLPDTMQAPTQSPRLLWPPTSDNDDTLFLWPPSREFYDEVAEAERARLALRQRQEYRRLLYVAMTRAEDRLIVCGWKNPKRREPADCWYHLIHNALRSDASDDTQEIDDPFLARSEEIDDSRVLRLSCPQEVEKPGTRPMAIQDTRPLPEWAARPPAPEPEPPLPLTPSRPEGDEPPVRSPMGADNGRRFKRGRLIHRLLQSLPELDRERRSEAARAWLSRPAHDLATEEQDEIVAEVAQVLEHPEFAPLFGPGSRAEVPLTGQVEGRVISGQVDRLLVTPESVVVLDYKTDRPAPKNASGVPSIYLKQMAAYRAALRLIYPRQPIRCVLLWTDEPRLMTLADTLLDGHAP